MPNRSFFLKIEVCFSKVGVCFYRKSEFVFWQAEYAFIENRSLFFGKSEFVFFENRGLIFGNRSLSFLKIGVCFLKIRVLAPDSELPFCSWVRTKSVADPGKGPGNLPLPPPLFLDQTEARRAEKKLFEDHPPPYLRVWMTPPPPYLKVFIPVFVNIWK